jgi:urease accessory protein
MEMMRSSPIAFVLAAGLALFAGVAEAHPFGAPGAGFAHGFVHPLGGLDHVLAMIAVGLWAAQLGDRTLWVVPAAFVGTMVLGGVLGAVGAPLPMVEFGIAASLVVLGALVAFGSRLPLAAAASIVGLFALFHGHAHGTELPETLSGLGYGAGFVLATALLHAFGIGLGLLSRGAARPALRAGGAAIAAAGLALILA